MSERIRLAIVGVGDVAHRHCLPAVRDHTHLTWTTF
jgi:predicted dehydrogenase